MLEEHNGSPVVGEVLGERASRASTLLTEVSVRGVHGRVEGISTDDLVEMGTGNLAGLDEAGCKLA